MIKHKIFFITLFFILAFSLPAQDFGLLLEQNVDVSGHAAGSPLNVNYTGTLIPYITAILGDNSELYFSAGVNYGIDPFSVLPELLRTEVTMRFGIGEIKVGRMPYRDPMGLIAEGLFDGVQLSYDTSDGLLSAGIWYTGFLYKKRAAITMTNNELKHSFIDVDYNDFYGTYFAPSRVLSSIVWEPPLLGGLFNSKFAFLNQFDLSDEDLHSQYFITKFTLPASALVIDLGGCFELIKNKSKFNIALAGDLGITFMLPTTFENHITLRGRISSGVMEDSVIGAFLPLTTVPQGELLKAKFSGMSVFSLNWTSRVHRAVALDLGAFYFARGDLGTYREYPVIGVEGGGFFMGTEICAGIVWAVSSELWLNLKGGVFLPSLGDAAPEASAIWRTTLNIVISLY